MGTTTFYLKHNDFGKSFGSMTKGELNKLDKISPHDKEHSFLGWNVPLELHNGNVYVLVFWKGRLMKLEEAPKILSKKYYDKYRGKNLKEYEWTLLRKLVLNEIGYLDRNFKKEQRKRKQQER